MPKRSKIIQVPLSEELLRRLDDASKRREQSRSAFIREASERLLKQLEDERLDREYAEGYRKFPETEEEIAWAKMGAELLAERLAEDTW